MVMLFVWQLGLSGPAFAQAIPDASTQDARLAQARELYKLGAGLYRAGRYREAIASFEEAHELSGNQKLLYNIANAHERLGELQATIDHLRQYRPHASASDVVSLDLRISALESRLEEQAELTPPPTEVTRPAPVAAPPPSPVRPPPTDPRPSLAAPPRNGPRWSLVGTGVAVALGFGATAVYTYLEGQDNITDNDQAAYQTNRTINNVAVPLAGVGGGLVVLGFALPQERTVRISATPYGAHIRLKL